MRKVLRYRERDIVRIKQNGKWQGFYRSSGRNSGLKGIFLPFDGISSGPWFIKNRFCGPGIDEKGLHRYGTEENKLISEKLGKEKIPEGAAADEIEVNKFLGNKYWQNWWAE